LEELNKLTPVLEDLAEIAQFLYKEPIHQFVKRLRNIILHMKFIDADWQIRRRGPDRETSFNFSRTKLLKAKGTKNYQEVKSYIGSLDESINVQTIFGEYSKKINSIWDRAKRGIRDDKLADYRACYEYLTRHKVRA